MRSVSNNRGRSVRRLESSADDGHEYVIDGGTSRPLDSCSRAESSVPLTPRSASTSAQEGARGPGR
jgi:hypothetical protein